jgi:hypothetical protein
VSKTEDNREGLVWVAVDIGCLECGESSSVIGLYATKAEAESAAAGDEQRQNWEQGQHSFQVFEAALPAGVIR